MGDAESPQFHFSGADAGDYTAFIDLGNGQTAVVNSHGVIRGPQGASGQLVPSGDGFDVQFVYPAALGEKLHVRVLGKDGTALTGTVVNKTQFDFTTFVDAPITDFEASINLGGGNTLVVNSSGKVSGPSSADGRIVASLGGGFEVRYSYSNLVRDWQQ